MPRNASLTMGNLLKKGFPETHHLWVNRRAAEVVREQLDVPNCLVLIKKFVVRANNLLRRLVII
jgi:hypothetical protein